MSEISVSVSISPPPQNVDHTQFPYPLEQTYTFPISSNPPASKDSSMTAPSPLCEGLEATRHGMNDILTKWKNVIGNEEKKKELEWEKNQAAKQDDESENEEEDDDE